ncbi:MAG: rhodanese-like domain-containing protein [Saprospiraceae bacterium]|nr:rhodanese-like domain-containing protein [Candidatus Opimibacter iunctus]
MTKVSEIINTPTKKVVRPGPSGKKEMSRIEKLLCGSGTESIRPANEILLAIKKGAFILDVRTIMEARKGIVPGAKNIPLLRLKRHLDELPRDKTIVTYCGTGARAGKAKDILNAAGFVVVNGGSYEGILEMLGVK